jgi:hypothetical protein
MRSSYENIISKQIQMGRCIVVLGVLLIQPTICGVSTDSHGNLWKERSAKGSFVSGLSTCGMCRCSHVPSRYRYLTLSPLASVVWVRKDSVDGAFGSGVMHILFLW